MIAVIVIIAVIVVVALLGGAVGAIKIVREYQRVVLFRLGRSSGARGPGLVVINPITDRVTLVDLREQFLEIPHQVAITKDNASIAIDFIIFYKVFDPVMLGAGRQGLSGRRRSISPPPRCGRSWAT